jgi:hypothetical protein
LPAEFYRRPTTPEGYPYTAPAPPTVGRVTGQSAGASKELFNLRTSHAKSYPESSVDTGNRFPDMHKGNAYADVGITVIWRAGLCRVRQAIPLLVWIMELFHLVAGGSATAIIAVFQSGHNADFRNGARHCPTCHASRSIRR